MIAVAFGAIYLGGWPFHLLVGIAAGLMLVEYCDMHRLRRTWPLVGLALLSFNLWAVPELVPARLPELDEWRIWFATAAFFALALAVGARSRRLGLGYIYIAIPALSLIFLDYVSWKLVLWALLVVWTTDIFAYFAGRSLGGPKLAPRISPNKTWSGLIGGVVGAAVIGWGAADVLELQQRFFAAGGAMAVLAQAGDLYESALKRRAGVKDSGTLLPGHGGVLDRLDGLLPVAVATWALALFA